jgi:hypothetical protein
MQATTIKADALCKQHEDKHSIGLVSQATDTVMQEAPAVATVQL